MEFELVHTHEAYAGDAATGMRAAVLVALLGGLPLAFVALDVLVATWRRAPRPWPLPAAAAFRIAFVIASAACLCSGLFLVLIATEAPSAAEFFSDPLVLLMIATLLGSAASLPAWRTAMLTAAPEGPPSVVTGRRG
jgi:hypothetical protein